MKTFKNIQYDKNSSWNLNGASAFKASIFLYLGLQGQSQQQKRDIDDGAESHIFLLCETPYVFHF